MPLSNEQITKIKEELDNCKNPLFFFHDDPDGLCSFLLLYRYKREGKGVVVKSVPKLDEKFVRKVNEYSPDKVFILDLAIVDQDFVDKVKAPIVWIDHHEPAKIHNVAYFNPRKFDIGDNTPVTYTCYQVTKSDLWIAMIGCLGDWMLPDFYDEFKKKYSRLPTIKSKDPGELLFSTKMGQLVRIFSFILKGKTDEAMKCVKILTRVEGPYEILEQTTPQGKFIYKRFEKINMLYQKLLKDALEEGKKSKDNLIIFTYKDNKMSFTGELSNELHYRFHHKLIVIGREKNDEIRMSLRSKKLLPPVLKKALQGLQGYGGGHEYACGANVKKNDFELFINRIRAEYDKNI